MAISAKQEDVLYEHYKNGEEMIFTGCNCEGIPFKTVGRLSTVTGKEMGLSHFESEDIFFGIVEDAFLVEFGGYDSDDKVRTKYSALFHTDLDTIFPEFINQFMLQSIRLKSSNEVLYYNEKYDDYFKNLKEAFKDRKEIECNFAEVEGAITIDKLLTAIIARPANIDGDKGVISHYTKSEKEGIKIYYINFNEIKSHILKNGVVFNPENGVWNIYYESTSELEK